MTDGLIFSIVRASVHDGPGIRTVVYFKGCSLRCAWCHNPEGISPKRQILSYPDRCIGCGRCAEICPLRIRGGFRTEGCLRCGRCADACPGEALLLSGTRMTAGELTAVVEKDEAYYRRSGGGVTFSGGECLLQDGFLREAAALCRERGIDTCCETALHADREKVAKTAVLMDRIYADLKHMDPAEHRRWTGADNGLILSNLRYLAENHPCVTVRIPLIPGVNDGEDNLSASAEFIRSCGPGGSRGGIRAVELLPYNELAGSKYGPLGLEGAVFSRWKRQTDGETEEKRALMRGILGEKIRVL